MIRTVIFDIDGLIIDSKSIESKALLLYCKRVRLKENGLINNPGRGDGLKEFMNEYQITEKEKRFIRKKRQIFASLIKWSTISYL